MRNIFSLLILFTSILCFLNVGVESRTIGEPFIYSFCGKHNYVKLYFYNKTKQCFEFTQAEKITGNPIDVTKLIRVCKSGGQKSEKKLSDFKYITYDGPQGHIQRTSYNTVIFEDGSLETYWLISRKESRYLQNLLNKNEFVIEIKMKEKEKGKWDAPILRVMSIGQDKAQENNNLALFNGIGMMFSFFFLLLVLLVYSILPELRNLAGMILMAYVANFMIVFLLKSSQTFSMLNGVSIDNKIFCRYTSIPIHYFIMTSMFWMNVLTFDIYWTFGGKLRGRPVNRRGETHKFLMYCLYAFGIPLLYIIGTVTVDYVAVSPNFSVPHYDRCMFEGKSKLYYLTLSMLVPLSGNFMLFFLTCYSLYKTKKMISKQMNQNGNNVSKNDKNRFILYFNLSIVMGVGWLLDVLITINEDLPLWVEYTFDSYNLLTGIFIFVIFICKRNILRMICKKFSIENRFTESFSASTKTTSTQLSKVPTRTEIIKEDSA